MCEVLPLETKLSGGKLLPQSFKNTKVMRISSKPSPVTIMIDQKHWRMWNVLNIWVAC